MLLPLLHISHAPWLMQTFSRDLLHSLKVYSDLFRPITITEGAPRWLLPELIQSCELLICGKRFVFPSRQPKPPASPLLLVPTWSAEGSSCPWFPSLCDQLMTKGGTGVDRGDGEEEPRFFLLILIVPTLIFPIPRSWKQTIKAVMKEISSCAWGEKAKTCPCPSRFSSQYKYHHCVLKTQLASLDFGSQHSDWSRWRKKWMKTSKLWKLECKSKLTA